MKEKSIGSFNEAAVKDQKIKALPRIVIAVCEFVPLAKSDRAAFEKAIGRIIDGGPAAGIHLVLATQCPCIEFMSAESALTNIPCRMAFKVANADIARHILGNASSPLAFRSNEWNAWNEVVQFAEPCQMMYRNQEGEFSRIACPRWSSVIESKVETLKTKSAANYVQSLMEIIDKTEPFDLEESATITAPDDSPMSDEDIREAIRVVRETGRATITHIQRKLGWGYNRAAEAIKALESLGVISPPSHGIHHPLLSDNELKSWETECGFQRYGVIVSD